MSTQLAMRGYPRLRSNINFDVAQGNPLCITNKVHCLPLTIVREDGTLSIWDECLFVVADAGASVIICNAVLKLGNILRYDPPDNYVGVLEQAALEQNMSPSALPRLSPSGGIWLPTARDLYGVPRHFTDEAGILRTSLETFPSQNSVPESYYSTFPGKKRPQLKILEIKTEGIDKPKDYSKSVHKKLVENFEQEIHIKENSNLLGENPGATDEFSHIQFRSLNLPKGTPAYHVERCRELYQIAEAKEPTCRAMLLATGAAPVKRVDVTKKKKGDTDMLSEENPYGKNPPLPEEVLEALRHLKKLSDPNTQPLYTEDQIKEARNRLHIDRPKWATSLILQQTLDVADLETELFLRNLMDKPKYQTSIFSLDLTGCCDLGEFELNQMDGEDSWNPPQPRRFKNPQTTFTVDAWLDALLDTAKCRPSKATHPAVVTVVEKEGRDARVCVDYRNRNARTKVPVFPMPDVQDFLDDTAGFKFYCSFDMAKMFNQFRIKEAHQHLAAFITHRGVFEPNVVLFGLSGGPQHAVREAGGAMAADPLTNGTDFTVWALEQNAAGENPPYEMDKSLGVIKGSRLKPFIDDVTIPSNHQEGMKKLVELWFEFCVKHKLILSKKKTKLMRKYLCMLGFVVSAEGKHLDPNRIIKLLEATLPQSKETLHALLSSYTFIRMFIPNFASIASPLYNATKGIIWKGKGSGRANGTRTVDPLFVWTPEMTRAYEQLRAALLESPILVQIDWDLLVFLSVDASIRGEGWVLWQLITLADGTRVAAAILYGSRKYSDTERNWETTRQEASAIRSALTDVYEYVFGRHFYLFSDHLNLRFMHNSVNRAVLRMRDFLSQFNMTVVHCPGIWNNADSMSRLETDRLPTELASDLNSASEAVMEGINLKISTGTSTSEEIGSESSTEIQPTGRKSIQTASGKSTEESDARILCTQVTPDNYSCFLCSCIYDHTVEISDDEVSNAYEETDALSLSLNTTAQVEPASINMEEWKDVLSHLGNFFHTHMDIRKIEVENWNAKFSPTYRRLLETELDTPLQVEVDEDLDWCGEINRPSMALLIAVAKNFKQKVTFDVSSLPGHIEEPMEIIENRFETQTTPADFRVVNIDFPMRSDFLAIHNNESGHHGVDYSYRKLLKRCGSKWANERGEATKIKADLKTFIESCPICQKVKGLRDKIKTKHSFIVSRPFLEVSYDFIVFKTEDKNGNRYLLVVIDNFLKLVEIKAVPSRDAETVAQFLLEIGARYGHTARLRSDREGSFTGLLIKKLNAVRGTEEILCIPYHPQANSICERQNGIIMEHLTALILGCKLGMESKATWSNLVPFVFSLVNTTPKNPLGISPLSMLYGVFANYDQPLLPTQQANAHGLTTNAADYVDELVMWQTKLLDITEQIQSDHFTKLEKRFNTPDRTKAFNVGDFVLQHKKSTGISGKPCARWIGPFLVMERTNNDPQHPVLHLMKLASMTIKEASIDDCRSFNTSWFEEDTLLPELITLAATDMNEYVVEKILSHKPQGNRTVPLSRYLFEVQWKEFLETTWEPYSSLKDIEPMEEYEALHPELKIKSRK